KLAVITFNYDRSLECFLLNALKSSFNKKDDECIKVLNKMPIIHLHGQLGTLLTGSNDPNHLSFDARCTPEVIERCIPQIKIIHEVNVSDDPEFKRAHEVLKKSERICFLGFVYDKTNLLRLFAPFDPGFLVKKMLGGTARGFTQ